MDQIQDSKSSASKSNAENVEETVDWSKTNYSSLPPPAIQFKMPSASAHEQPLESKYGEFSKLAQDFSTSSGADVSSFSVEKNDSLLDSLGAKGISSGNKIIMSSSDHPESSESKDTFMHEMVHAVQKSEGRVQATSTENGIPVNDNSSLESEAENWSSFKAQSKAGKKSGNSQSYQLKKSNAQNTSKGQQNRSPFQLKSSKKHNGPHVKFNPKLSRLILGYNAYLQFYSLGKEMWDEINKLKTGEGWLDLGAKYLGIADNNIDATLEKHQKIKREYDVSYSKDARTDITEKHQNSGSKRLKNAVDGASNIAGQAAYQGIKMLLKLKSYNLKDYFFWALDEVVAKEHKDELKDFKSIFGWTKLKEFGEKVTKEVYLTKITSNFLSDGPIMNDLKAGGFSDSKYRNSAINNSTGDFKAAISMMLGSGTGISLDKKKWWSDMSKIRSQRAAEKFLKSSHKYLTVDTEKGLKHNDVIFNSRFIRPFNKEYLKSKGGKT